MSPMAPSLFPPSLLPEMAAQHFARASPFNPFSAAFQKDVDEAEREKEETESTKQLIQPKEEVEDEQASDLSTGKERKRKVSEKECDTSEGDLRSVSDLTDNEEEFEKGLLKVQKTEEQPTVLSNGNSAKSAGEKAKEEAMSTLSALEIHVMKSISQVSPQTTALFVSTTSSPEKSSALDLTPKGSQDSNSQSSPASCDSRNFASSPYAGLQFHPTGRPNTTCRICCKTFACYSALEIHIRSHTKERPFKCEACDRGFSTKGNMKQHMLTHKIRDLPPELYSTVSPPSNTTLGNFLTSNNISKILRKQSNNTNNANSSNNSNCSSRVSSPHTPNGHNSNSMDSDKALNSEPSPIGGDQSSSTSSRASGSNKHMCHICNKPFSSGSALQVSRQTCNLSLHLGAGCFPINQFSFFEGF